MSPDCTPIHTIVGAVHVLAIANLPFSRIPAPRLKSAAMLTIPGGRIAEGVFAAMRWTNTFKNMEERRYYGSKVPEITLSFWVAKILTTAMGEATSDFLVLHVNPYFAVMSGGLGFLIALVLQFATRSYGPVAYWLLVVMVSIFGTMVADVVHVVLGVPYALSTTMFALVLAVIIWGWNRSERTLSIHSIRTPRREAFYWATVVATFALGTAAGDLTASTFQLGYLGSAILFTLLFALPGVCYFMFKVNEVSAFWAAYILTRPMGASFADWLDKPKSVNGLGLGTEATSAVLSTCIAVAIAYIWARHRRRSVVPAMVS